MLAAGRGAVGQIAERSSRRAGTVLWRKQLQRILGDWQAGPAERGLKSTASETGEWKMDERRRQTAWCEAIILGKDHARTGAFPGRGLPAWVTADGDASAVYYQAYARQTWRAQRQTRVR